MKLAAYRDEIKLKLTGGVLELEITDSTLNKLINSAFREVQRYIDNTKFVTLDYSTCIDMSKYNVSSVSRVYRDKSYTGDNIKDGVVADPMYVAQWQLLAGNGNLDLTDWAYNFAAWNTALQVRNTLSTDLAYMYDKTGNKLYVNCAYNKPSKITVEFVQEYKNVEEINSDYWIDIILKMATALAKVTLGRIRSRYVQSNALWTQDGDTMLSEGNEELKELREVLRTNSQLCYPID